MGIPRYLAVGTFTNVSGEQFPTAFGHRSALSRGIQLIPFDPDTGSFGPARLAAELSHPANLVVHPDRRHLYACCGHDARIGTESPVTGFAIGSDGRLDELGTVGSGGHGPTVGVVDPSGAYLLVTNWITSNVVCLRLGPDGAPRELTAVAGRTDVTAPLPSGVGGAPGLPVAAEAVEAGHTRPHDVALSPSGRFAVATEISGNRCRVLRFDSGRGSLTDLGTAPAPPGTGPRHLTFHPDGRHVYTSDEDGVSISLWDWDEDTGAMRHRQRATTLPPGGDGAGEHPADVRIHPGGGFVYVTNRSVGTIAGFRIDPATGAVSPAGHTPVGSASCWSLDFDDTGRWAFATAIIADEVRIHAVDPQTGALHHRGSVPVTLPTCVRWI